jgi:ceramide glucosyltransferase
VLDGSLMGFPVLVGIHPTGLNGKLWTARRSTITQIGGFEALLDFLGEDIEMARRALAAGLSVVPVSATCRALGGPSTFVDVVLRISRWMSVVRAQSPRLLPAYPLLFAPMPLALVLAAMAAVHHPALALATVGMTLLGRVVVALTGQLWSNRGLGLGAALVDVALGDLVIVLAFARALARRDVVWRGTRLRLERNGRIVVLSSEPRT